MAQKPNKTTVQVEDLKERGNLQSSINPGGLYSYDEARPAYVERPDDLRSNPWMQLSGALQDFDAPLKDYVRQKQADELEQGVAQGGDLFSQYGSDPTTGNKLAWKDVIEKHPELAGKNPWLEKGYESARLQALGLDFKAQMQDAYTSSGMVNERDVNKIGQFVDQFEKEFRKSQGLHEYPDKVTLGETFTRTALEAKNSIFNRHIQDKEQQNLARTRDQYTMLFSKELSGIIDDPNVNFSDPNTVSQVVLPKLVASIQRIAGEASLNGLPEPEVQDMVFKALAAEAIERGHDGGGDEILEIINDLDFGKGRLGDLPAVKDWISKTESQFINQQRSDEAEAERQREKQLRENEKNAVRAAVRLAREGKVVTPDMLVSMGVDEYNLSSALSKANAVRQSLDKESQITWTSELWADFGRDRLKAMRGQMSDTEIPALYMRYGSKADTLTVAHQGSLDNEDTRYASLMESGQNKLFSILGKDEKGNAIDFDVADTGNPAVQRAIEAGNMFVDIFAEKIEEEKAKKGGEVSASRLNNLYRQSLEEALKNPDFNVYPPKPESGLDDGPQGLPEASQPLPPEVSTKPLFGTQEELRQAAQEFAEAPDKSATRLVKVAQSLGITTPQGLISLLQTQQQFYAENVVPGGVIPDPWTSRQLSPSDQALYDLTKQKLQGQNNRTETE